MVYDLDWDENARLTSWGAAVLSTESMPSVLAAAIALLAWEEIEPLQTQGLAREAPCRRDPQGSFSNPIASSLREHGSSRDRTRSTARARPTTKLVALLDGLADAAKWGMKEHDRWLLARRQLDRRLVGRRSNSSRPVLADLVVARPILSAGLIAQELKVTPRAAQDLVSELDLREMTGRGRYRAWGIL